MSLDHDRFKVPLASLRAFEAAGRLGSFTAAARELGLTQSAISRHVRALEDSFAVKLFDRRGRGIMLTPPGEAYFRPVTEGLRLIRAASHEMQMRRRHANRLVVSLLPSVAALWLAPRLADFTARHPNLELHVHASRSLIDFDLDEVDVSIRYGLGKWEGTRSERIATEYLTPVCSPDFARHHRLGEDPTILLRLPLLSDDLADDWAQWFEAAGIEGSPALAGPRLNDSTSLYHAAASGLGVALGRSLLIERALRGGQLVTPFEIRVPATFAYWLVLPDRGEPAPATRLFMQWAREQMLAGLGTS